MPRFGSMVWTLWKQQLLPQCKRGSDSSSSFHHWAKPPELVHGIEPMSLSWQRRTLTTTPTVTAALAQHVIKIPSIELSSTGWRLLSVDFWTDKFSISRVCVDVFFCGRLPQFLQNYQCRSERKGEKVGATFFHHSNSSNIDNAEGFCGRNFAFPICI